MVVPSLYSLVLMLGGSCLQMQRRSRFLVSDPLNESRESHAYRSKRIIVGPKLKSLSKAHSGALRLLFPILVLATTFAMTAELCISHYDIHLLITFTALLLVWQGANAASA
ncbi:hypothetical protein IG631_02887 [Alternaria alternata]|nr:hypothetical protein IG631_02887 [Alternaria alternata]